VFALLVIGLLVIGLLVIAPLVIAPGDRLDTLLSRRLFLRARRMGA
jgi:hypothetical protein